MRPTLMLNRSKRLDRSLKNSNYIVSLHLEQPLANKPSVMLTQWVLPNIVWVSSHTARPQDVVV